MFNSVSFEGATARKKGQGAEKGGSLVGENDVVILEEFFNFAQEMGSRFLDEEIVALDMGEPKQLREFETECRFA